MITKPMTIKSLFNYSTNNFFDSVFLIKLNAINLFAFVGSLTSFITQYVWDSSQAVYTLVSLMIFDWVLETYLALRASYLLRTRKEELTPKKRIALSKKQFKVAKFVRIIFAIIVAFWMLGIAWNLSKANPLFYFLPGFVYGGFSGVYVISLYKAMTEIGFFNKDFLEVMKEKLNMKKYIRIDKSGKDDNDNS